MMERVAATRSIVVVLVVVSSLFVLSLARRTIDQLPGDAEGSASSLQTLAYPNLLLLPRGQSDQDPDKRTNLEEAAAAEEEDDPAALAVPDRRPPDADLDAPRSGAGACGDAATLPAAAAAAEEEEENAVAGAEADRSSAEVMGWWIPKEKEGERAKKRGKKKKKRGKKPCDSDSDSNSDSDSDSDSDDEEEEDEGEAKKKMKMKMKMKKKGKDGFLRWFWNLVNRF